MRISAIIPAYNCADFIADAVESVFSQSYPVHELIVVDDGSTDDTAAVVRRFGDNVIYRRTENGGVASARNTGLALATGDCIAFLDADDSWYPRKLELQVRVLEAHQTVQAVCCDFSLVDQFGALIHERYVKGKYRVFQAYSVDWSDVFSEHEVLSGNGVGTEIYFGDAFPVLFLGNFVNTSSLLVRRKTIDAAGRFTVGRLTQEDYELWLKLALRGPMAYIDWPLLLFRKRPNQLTSENQKLRIAQDVVDVVTGVTDAARQRVGRRMLARRLADVHRTLALVYLGLRQAAAARRVLVQGCAYGGIDWGTAVLYLWSWLPARVADGLRLAGRCVRRRSRLPTHPFPP